MISLVDVDNYMFLVYLTNGTNDLFLEGVEEDDYFSQAISMMISLAAESVIVLA